MIQIEPNEPTNYFALAKIYEDGGRYDDAEQTLLKAKEVKPNDPQVYTTISGFYNRQGDFDKTIEALKKPPISSRRTRRAISCSPPTTGRRPTRITACRQPRKRTTSRKGFEATDKALALNPEYADALTYKNLLLRMEGNEETDMAKRAALYKQADELREKAIELKQGPPVQAGAKARREAKYRRQNLILSRRAVRIETAALLVRLATKKVRSRANAARRPFFLFRCVRMRISCRSAGWPPRRISSVTMPTFSTPAPFAASMTAMMSP